MAQRAPEYSYYDIQIRLHGATQIGAMNIAVKNITSREHGMQGDINNHDKKNFIWNMVAGLINASEAVILLAVVSRTNGVFDAGVLTIAFAVANLLATIGKYGIRSFQVTDVEGQFTFNTYFTTRIITVSVMMVIAVSYALYGYWFKQYSWDKTCVILFVCMIYAVEAFEDVFAGLYQRKGRLDVGGKIFSARWSVILGLFSIVLICKQDLFNAALFSLLASIICCMIFLYYTYSCIASDSIHMCFLGVKDLIIRCAPLFLSTFLQFYLINAPKYAIDDYLTEDVQACYGFVAMPVFVIGLFSNFLFQPIMVKMAIQWREGDYIGFIGRIRKQIGIITIVTVFCLLGAYVLGVPLLSLLYSTDLYAYKVELLILLLGGGFLAVVSFFCVLLTTMRKQKWVLGGYALVSVIGFLIMGRIVRMHGIMGAAVTYTTLIGGLALILALMIAYTYHKRIHIPVQIEICEGK